MKHHTRLAMAAGILIGAAALAGCQQDNSGIATGPGPVSPATSGVRTPAPETRAGTPPAPVGDAIMRDGGSVSQSWSDADGHVYQVVFGAGTVSHFRDDVLFAVTADQVGGTDVAVYDQGLLIQDQFIAAGVPSAIRGIDSIVRPHAREFRPRREGEEARVGGPQRMKVIPCSSEINGYLIASGELVIAGAYLQRNPNLRKAQVAFTAAVGNFWLAWRALYDCEYRASWG